MGSQELSAVTPPSRREARDLIHQPQQEPIPASSKMDPPLAKAEPISDGGSASGITCKKSGKEGKRLARLSRDLLVKLKGKKELHRQWKQRQVSWREYKDAARLCRYGVRKAKGQLELNLARDAKNNKKGSYRYVSKKRKVKESVPHLMNTTGKLVTKDEEKGEVLKNFFASVFTGNLSSHTSRVDGLQDGD
ncbi:hypothetical protein QYF61_015109 [Mycteria americana]|uniref:Uncharacterized protein n=1 Tax=Mycteria americana TaxID=33587 RepID=A0AAN7P7H4_MYCAM|nr:hypothetical protein QYF61_015109 [Mycteria americana]